MYIAGFVIPVPEEKMEAYRKWAENGAAIFREYGCIEIVEPCEDNVPSGKYTGSAGHITWEQAERAMKQGFLPHTISTDWTPQGRAGGAIDLPNVMSKFPLLGHVAQLMTRSRPSRCKSPFWRLDFWWPPWTVSGCSAS